MTLNQIFNRQVGLLTTDELRLALATIQDERVHPYPSKSLSQLSFRESQIRGELAKREGAAYATTDAG